MTVKELKEKLEILIEDGKGDYTVFVDYYHDDFSVYVDNKKKEVELQ
jgi:hypothetical protein